MDCPSNDQPAPSADSAGQHPRISEVVRIVVFVATAAVGASRALDGTVATCERMFWLMIVGILLLYYGARDPQWVVRAWKYFRGE